MKGPVRALAVALACALTLAGCWNRREVNDVSIVSAAAVDRTADGQVELTVLIAKPAALGGAEQQGVGQPDRAVYWMAAQGQTVADAVRQLSHLVSRKPGWHHNNVLIFGEEAARGGIADLLDFFLRDHEARLDQWILVSRGRAADAVTAAFELEPNYGLGLRRAYRGAWIYTGEVLPVRLYEFLVALTTPGRDPVAGVLAPLLPGEYHQGETATERKRRIGGAAVFRQDRLVGWLTDREARGVAWLRSKVVHGVVPVPCREPGGGISLAVLGSRARLVPEWHEGALPQVRAVVRVDARLNDLMCPEDVVRPEAMAALARRAAEVIEDEIGAALRRLQQELRADPIGVGEALYRAYPRQARSWLARWDQVFPAIHVVPEVTVTIPQTGMTSGRPLWPGAGGQPPRR